MNAERNQGNGNQGQLGWIVSWSVPKEITLEKLRDSLTAAGLDPALALDMRNEHALRRALRDMNDHRVIRKLRREGTSVYFQFTHEYLTEHRAEYVREAELCLDTVTGNITADDSTIADVARTLLAEHLSKRLTSDLTRIVQRIYSAAKADLIPIRDEGFVYFVPQAHEDLVTKSRQLLDAIGGKLRSFAVKLGSDETSASVAESMADYFVDLIDSFRDNCKSLNEDTRVDVRARRMGTIGEMRSKLECYRGLLAGMAERIDGEISEAETEMLKALARPVLEDVGVAALV